MSGAMAARTHCPRGHRYSVQNTYVNKTAKSRSCRTCGRIRAAATYAANREKILADRRTPHRRAVIAKWRAGAADELRAAQREDIAGLTDWYVANRLGISVVAVPPRLLALKRAHLAALRLLRTKTRTRKQ